MLVEPARSTSDPLDSRWIGSDSIQTQPRSVCSISASQRTQPVQRRSNQVQRAGRQSDLNAWDLIQIDLDSKSIQTMSSTLIRFKQNAWPFRHTGATHRDPTAIPRALHSFGRLRTSLRPRCPTATRQSAAGSPPPPHLPAARESAMRVSSSARTSPAWARGRCRTAPGCARHGRRSRCVPA